MAGILQFLDFNHASTSRKLFVHKKHNDGENESSLLVIRSLVRQIEILLCCLWLFSIGLEAPRNSLEFPMEASQSYQIIHEDVPVSKLFHFNLIFLES